MFSETLSQYFWLTRIILKKILGRGGGPGRGREEGQTGVGGREGGEEGREEGAYMQQFFPTNSRQLKFGFDPAPQPC